MATLTPETVEGLPSEQAVVDTSASTVFKGLSSIARTRETAKGPSVRSQDDALDKALIRDLKWARAQGEEFGMTKGNMAYNTVIVNYVGAGGSLDDSKKEAISRVSGRPFETVGYTQEEIAFRELAQTPEYQGAVAAGIGSLPKGYTQAELKTFADEYIVQQKAADVAVKRANSGNILNWETEGKQGYHTSIGLWWDQTLGALALAEEQGTMVAHEDILNSISSWEKKKALLGTPQGLTAEQWKPITDRYEAIDKYLVSLKNQTSNSAVSARIAGQLMRQVISADPKSTKNSLLAALIGNDISVLTNFADVAGDMNTAWVGSATTEFGSQGVSNFRLFKGNSPELEGTLDKLSPEENVKKFNGFGTALKLANSLSFTDPDAKNSFILAANEMSTVVKNLSKKGYLSEEAITANLSAGLVANLKELSKTDPESAEILMSNMSGAAADARQQLIANLQSMENSSPALYDPTTGGFTINSAWVAETYGREPLANLNSAVAKLYGGDMTKAFADKHRTVGSIPLAADGTELTEFEKRALVTVIGEQDLNGTAMRERVRTIKYLDTILEGLAPKEGSGTGSGSDTGEQAYKNPNDAVLTMIKGFEGYSEGAYYDVNAFRAGYGSDTTTLADGSVVRITEDTVVTREDSERDLARRSQEFANKASRQVGKEIWVDLPANITAALTSVAYNYGSLPKSLVKAVKAGDKEGIAAAVEALGSDNDGVNNHRRVKEAAFIRGKELPASVGPIYTGKPVPRGERTPSGSFSAPVQGGDSSSSLSDVSIGGGGDSPIDQSHSTLSDLGEPFSEFMSGPSSGPSDKGTKEKLMSSPLTRSLLDGLEAFNSGEEGDQVHKDKLMDILMKADEFGMLPEGDMDAVIEAVNSNDPARIQEAMQYLNSGLFLDLADTVLRGGGKGFKPRGGTK